jgi:hypothetical protein
LPEDGSPARRIALGVSYRGGAYQGWQSQPGGRTVQDQLEAALSAFAAQPVTTLCAGRTDAGVHGLNQVVHLDAPVEREPFSWVRGTNRYLPADIAVQWCRAGGSRLPCPQQRARAALPLRGAGVARAPGAGAGPVWLGRSARWTATPCAPQPRT